eukprot:gb/GECG01000527.1/.p1 GENE.gb/GECG01000527.1/~~gb/GECG01000527.1/.p1  ORF type:complete len:160 (+),score=10.95 gb/GECG01000527.1/:1-480(+)
MTDNPPSVENTTAADSSWGGDIYFPSSSSELSSYTSTSSLFSSTCADQSKANPKSQIYPVSHSDCTVRSTPVSRNGDPVSYSHYNYGPQNPAASQSYTIDEIWEFLKSKVTHRNEVPAAIIDDPWKKRMKDEQQYLRKTPRIFTKVFRIRLTHVLALQK